MIFKNVSGVDHIYIIKLKIGGVCMKHKLTWIVIVILVIGSILFMGSINVNYDLKKYLPKDTALVEGIDLYENHFGTSSYIVLMVEDLTLGESLALYDDLLTTEEVSSIDFIPSVLNPFTYASFLSSVDLTTASIIQGQMDTMMGLGLSFEESFYQVVMSLPDEAKESFLTSLDQYQQGNDWRMTLTLSIKASDPSLDGVIDQIETKIETTESPYYLTGGLMSTRFTRQAIEGEIMKITWIIIPLILIILLLMTPSFADLIVFIIVSGVAIIINLGTNALLPDVSFITQSMAIALQLAISLDYIIFIVHRNHEDRKEVTDPTLRIQTTLSHVKSPVIASALTTAVSFLALIFMRFSIGMDIGIVFMKAVILSVLSSLIIGPMLIRGLDLWIEKSKHRVFIPRFSAFARFVYRFRFVFLVTFLLLIAPAYYFQSHNQFIYGESSLTGSEGSSYYDDEQEVVKKFGYHTQMVILMEEDVMKESSLMTLLYQDTSLPIQSISGYPSLFNLTSDPLILSTLEGNFHQDGWARIILDLNMPEESDESFTHYQTILNHLQTLELSNAYVLGSTSAAITIKDVIEDDYLFVNLIALGLIMIVIFVTFKNLLLPIILPLVIVTSVFLAMSIPYLIGDPLSFLGYLIVSTILLGATIDYAILFTKRYIEIRKSKSAHESIQMAIGDTAPSITTSAIIFGIAGLSVGVISSILTIKQIGLQIALGAFFGMLTVLVLLPQLIYIFDKWIVKSSI
jgi:predicted RND superfamily exporter protein